MPDNPTVESVSARSSRRAIVIGLAIGILGLAILWFYRSTTRSAHRPDFDHLHAAAQFVLSGRDPYQLIGPGREYWNEWPLYYPLPAVLTFIPLAPLPVAVARACFVFAMTALFGYSLALRGGSAWRYAILLSLPFTETIRIAQWSPLFYAMWTLPWLAGFAIVKPHYGGAILAARPIPRRIIIAAVAAATLTAASFMTQPGWFAEWIATVRAAHHFKPAMARTGGFLLALSALKWRRPEARLLFFLSLIPATPGYYDTLPLFLVTITGGEIVALVALGHVMGLITHGPWATWDQLFDDVGQRSIWFLFLPVLYMVLRRPNVGEVPAWIERRSRGLPGWLRGQTPVEQTLTAEVGG